MYPLFGLLAALGIVMWRVVKNSTPGVWTPERQALYRVAISTETDAGKLKALAAKFRADGFPEEASNLEARAALPSMHGEKRAKYAAIARKAFRSRNPAAVREVAAGYERLGMGATAEALRNTAAGIDVAKRSGQFRGAPFPTGFHLALVPNGAPAASPSPSGGVPDGGAPNGGQPADMAAQHAALHQDHAALHQDHGQLSAEHGIIMAALQDIQAKLSGAPWLQGVNVGGEGATECIVVYVTDATPDVIDAIPTHARGVPVRVVDGRG